jgi:hypothetical protein
VAVIYAFEVILYETSQLGEHRLSMLQTYISFVDPNFKLCYGITVSRYPEDPFGFGSSQSEYPVGEEREDNRDFTVCIRALLQFQYVFE